MGNYYGCASGAHYSYEYGMFKGVFWPYHVFINPQWKKEWDNKIYDLGYIIMYSGHEELTLEIRNKSTKLGKWIDDLPRSKRVELEKASIAFARFNIEYRNRVIENTLGLKGYEIRISGKLKKFAGEFSSMPQFMTVFEEITKKSEPQDKRSYMDFVKLVRKKMPDPPAIDMKTGLPVDNEGGRSLSEFSQSLEYKEFLQLIYPRMLAERESHAVGINIILKNLFEKPNLLQLEE